MVERRPYITPKTGEIPKPRPMPTTATAGREPQSPRVLIDPMNIGKQRLDPAGDPLEKRK